MDWQKTEVIINKINALYKSMSMAKESLSSIERDLMLNYIRSLYEQFLTDNQDNNPRTFANAGRGTSRRPDFEVVDTDRQRKEEPVKPPKPASPKIIEVPESLKRFDKPNYKQRENVQPTPNRPEPVKPDPIIPPQPSRPEPPRPAPPKAPPVVANAKFNALFEFKSSSELADRLGDRPVADLTKALSINDRLLYMHQLFGKDMKELDQSLQLLNRFESIDEAKSIILTLAEQHHWMDEEKFDIAKDFVRLVRRRYL